MPAEMFRVEGLKEFRSALRDAGKDVAKELQKENKALAVEVAAEVRTAYSALHPALSGRGMGSIRGLATGVTAAVAIGSDRAPYVLGQEFGANHRSLVGRAGGRGRRVGRGRSSMRQFPLYQRSGHFLYPTLRSTVPKIKQRYLTALNRVAAFGAGR